MLTGLFRIEEVHAKVQTGVRALEQTKLKFQKLSAEKIHQATRMWTNLATMFHPPDWATGRGGSLDGTTGRSFSSYDHSNELKQSLRCLRDVYELSGGVQLINNK